VHPFWFVLLARDGILVLQRALRRRFVLFESRRRLQWLERMLRGHLHRRHVPVRREQRTV